MYTDGLSEARDAAGEFFSVPALAPLVASTTVEDALDAVVEAVCGYVPGGHLTDDLAVMVLENMSVETRQPKGQPEQEPVDDAAPSPARLSR
jgi:hypothetical protein